MQQMVPSRRPGITLRDQWRDDVVEVTRELGPPMMRWGGIFSDFYRWREGVGPRGTRPPMLNLLWGGIESNQVGTGEFVDLCRRAGAEPLICVNFESDGRKQYMKVKDSVRTADAREAAEWVAYCNDSANAERQAHGSAAPLGVRHWQIGNETSYDKNGFDLETAARKTVEFAKSMREADPAIQLIAPNAWRLLNIRECCLDPRRQLGNAALRLCRTCVQHCSPKRRIVCEAFLGSFGGTRAYCLLVPAHRCTAV